MSIVTSSFYPFTLINSTILGCFFHIPTRVQLCNQAIACVTSEGKPCDAAVTVTSCPTSESPRSSSCHVLLTLFVSLTIASTDVVLQLHSTSAPVDPTAPTFHPISANPSELLGELEPKDTEWLATSSGFVTETQGFYNFLEDGSFVMCQVIHSSIG